MIALCNKRARPIRCLQADFWAGVPEGDAKFDAVIALFGSLAHPPNQDARAGLAREVARVLRPSGLFYAEVPTPAWAAKHPTFTDDATGAGIDVAAASESAWRGAFTAFDVEVLEQGSEFTVVGRLKPRSQPSPAAR
jgi:SAM-dependent methyltransferase